jgi:hypothetical protein
MKPSIFRDMLYGTLLFLLLVMIVIMSGKTPQFVYVMF